MGVGQLTEKVVVIAETAVVQTASAERRSVLEAEQLDSLIARGRDPIALLNLLPGVTPTTGTTSLGGQIGANTPTIAGQVGSSAGMRVDGMVTSDPDTGNNNSPMSMDASRRWSSCSMVCKPSSGGIPGRKSTSCPSQGPSSFTARWRLRAQRGAERQQLFQQSAWAAEGGGPLPDADRHARRPGAAQGCSRSAVLLLQPGDVENQRAHRQWRIELDDDHAEPTRAAGGLFSEPVAERPAARHPRPADRSGFSRQSHSG